MHGDGQVRDLHDGRLAADARRDRRVRPATQGHVRPRRSAPTSTSRWLFLGFMLAFAIKAPLVPFHGWLPDAYREAPAEVAGAPLRRDREGAASTGCCGSRSPLFPEPASYYRTAILALAAIDARVRLAARVPRARLPRRRRVFVARAVGAHRARLFAAIDLGARAARCCRWSRTASSRCRSSCSRASSSGGRRPASSGCSAGWRAAGRCSRRCSWRSA